MAIVQVVERLTDAGRTSGSGGGVGFFVYLLGYGLEFLLVETSYFFLVVEGLGAVNFEDGNSCALVAHVRIWNKLTFLVLWGLYI